MLFSCLDLKATIGGKHHYLLYCLAAAMKPRMLLTLDEEGRPLPVPCRVGTAVDVVAQAGRPKTITGEYQRRGRMLSYARAGGPGGADGIRKPRGVMRKPGSRGTNALCRNLVLTVPISVVIKSVSM